MSGEQLEDRLERLRLEHAISLEVMARVGVFLPCRERWTKGAAWKPGYGGQVIPYRHPDGRVTEMYRLTDEERAETLRAGKLLKYRWPTGVPSHFSVIHDAGPDSPVVLVEGTLQPLAVASWIGPGYTVLGMNGVDGYHDEDMTRWAGRPRPFYVWPDKDVSTKRPVWDAMHAFAEKAEICGITDLKFVAMPARGNDGADDFLRHIDESKRPEVVANLLAKARDTLPRKPAAPRKTKVRTGSSAQCFDADDNFLAATAAALVLDASPAALTPEDKIAMYRDGVYGADGKAFTGTVVELLGEEYRPYYTKIITDVAVNTLERTKAYLPEQASEPLLNVRNGMVDLRTGELLPHDPKYRSGVQLPVDYDPAATCPTYERWIKEVCPDQVEDLEEVGSQMLDPSGTPTKAGFLYGPPRSGKSTQLRLWEALAGRHHSAVPLHTLCADRFAAANVYGSILNAAADLSSAHVEDLSTFKAMTGEDRIHANRKYGGQFTFTNRAFFAFSANDPPTVSESSGAYRERIKPFRFGQSFAGNEDPEIERAMLGELPGILCRLILAWRGRHERGRFLETAPDVREEFDARSDRVRLWVQQRGRICRRADNSAPVPGCTMPEDRCTPPRFLAKMFNTWAEDQGGKRMGEQAVIRRLTRIDGVEQVRRPNKIRALNIIAWAVGEELPDDHPAERGAEVAISSFVAVREGVSETPQGQSPPRSCGFKTETATSAPASITRSFDQ